MTELSGYYDELGELAADDWRPIPPTNVRIVYSDGREVACPVKYLGYGHFTEGSNAKHFGWRVLNEGPFDARVGDTIAYDYGSMPMYIECPGTGSRDA